MSKYANLILPEETVAVLMKYNTPHVKLAGADTFEFGNSLVRTPYYNLTVKLVYANADKSFEIDTCKGEELDAFLAEHFYDNGTLDDNLLKFLQQEGCCNIELENGALATFATNSKEEEKDATTTATEFSAEVTSHELREERGQISGRTKVYDIGWAISKLRIGGNVVKRRSHFITLEMVKLSNGNLLIIDITTNKAWVPTQEDILAKDYFISEH